MERNVNEKIKIETIVNAPIDKVWVYWTEPVHIVKWNQASDDWHSPYAENVLRALGRFSFRMESKDGKEGFDFSGTYNVVEPLKYISYTMDDERKVEITFNEVGNKTEIVEVFEAEHVYSVEQQRLGWQSILNNFKKYVEEH